MPTIQIEPGFTVIEKPATGQDYFDMIDVPLKLFPSAYKNRVVVLNVEVTVEMAKAIVSFPTRMQRPSRDANIKKFGASMTNKEFDTDNPVVVGLLTTDLSPAALSAAPAYLLDGLHRTKGIVKEGQPQVFDIVFRTFPTVEAMRTYALTLDSGGPRNHHHQGSVAEFDIRLGVGKHDAGAYTKAIRAIMREGLDPTLPFTPEDEVNGLRVEEVGEHYLNAGKLLFNLLRYGDTKPEHTAVEVHLDFRKQIRQIPILAPLLVWINKDSALIRSFMSPIILNNQMVIKPVQNTFLELVRQGFEPKAAEYRSVFDELPPPGYLKSGNKTQRRALMATLLCLERFRSPMTRSRQYLRTNLVKDVLRSVDLVISRKGGEIAWPSPVQTGVARGANR